ncbi:hypothetical protein [Geodermatophilus sp. CPCC 205506]
MTFLADVQRCLDAPDDVSPDPDTPSRTGSGAVTASSSRVPTGRSSG